MSEKRCSKVHVLHWNTFKQLSQYLILEIYHLTWHNTDSPVFLYQIPTPNPFYYYYFWKCVRHMCMCLCTYVVESCHTCTCDQLAHISRDSNLFTGHYALRKMRKHACVRHLIGCVCDFSERVSVRAYRCNTPSDPGGTCCHGYCDGGGRSWAIGLWPVLLQPWKESCSAGHMGLITNYSGSRDPYRSLRPGGPSNEWSVLVEQ